MPPSAPMGSGSSQAVGQGQGARPCWHWSAVQMRCERRGAGMQPLQGWVLADAQGVAGAGGGVVGVVI